MCTSWIYVSIVSQSCLWRYLLVFNSNRADWVCRNDFRRLINRNLGRVFGLMGAMYSGFLPVGMVVFGPLSDIFSLQWIMVSTGIALAFLAIYLLNNRMENRN